jgi:ubiquinone/menaquinone biosynthesis C-methylase UbiE
VPLPTEFAHRRYTQQAGWTAHLRRHIFTRAGLPNARRVLEIGCGTGAVLASINNNSASIFGLDIDRESLQFAKASAKNAALINGDAFHLPVADNVFDISFFHYVLLWLKDPALAITEARRVTRLGGAIIAFAEPDYSQRKTVSPELSKINDLQMKSLRVQGADPTIGSRLGKLFSDAGIQPIEFGQMDSESEPPSHSDLELELEVLRSDLASQLPAENVDALISQFNETEDFVTFQVPTFFCLGHVSIP